MSKPDYYEVLGVSKTVSDSELKITYRRLAMKYHPDRNPGDSAAEAKFKECKEAYEVLADPNKRAAYDQYGHAGIDPSMGGGGARNSGFGDVFDDLFGDIFGGGRRSGNRAYRGSDLQYNLELNLEEAVFGTEVDIRVPTLQECDSCHGTGAKKGTHPQTCGTCHGQGQIRMQQGFFSVQQTCPQCRGTGKTITDPCPDCRGQGRIEEQKTLSVKIPVGVDTGDRIRLSGEGEAGVNGGPSGDLYVQIFIKPHELFTREQDNLFCDVPLRFTTAALGGEIQVPTLEGEVALRIPPETQTGKKFRLRGKGVKSVRSASVGDLICTVVLETPINLTKHQRDLMEELDKTMIEGGQRHSPQAHSWLGKAKTFFDDVKDWFDPDKSGKKSDKKPD